MNFKLISNYGAGRCDGWTPELEGMVASELVVFESKLLQTVFSNRFQKCHFL